MNVSINYKSLRIWHHPMFLLLLLIAVLQSYPTSSSYNTSQLSEGIENYENIENYCSHEKASIMK